MELAHNQVFTIKNSYVNGIFRVIIHAPQEGTLVLVKIQDVEDTPTIKNENNEKSKIKRHKNLLTKLIWVDSQSYKQIFKDDLKFIEIEPEAIYLKCNLSLDSLSLKDKEIFFQRKLAMENFLDLENLRLRILADHSLGGLVKESVHKSEFTRMQIYKLFSELCKRGFSESNLLPRFDLCGAPGIVRPCDNTKTGVSRNKAGRKTAEERIAKTNGIIIPNCQPGMSTDWHNRIIAADSLIPNPKPSLPARATAILNSSFVQKYKLQTGILVPIEPKIGEYPNKSQIKRVLNKNYSDIERAKQKTTDSNFTLNQRGLTGKNWEGVGGPGHTWAIDSSVGDIYLRSFYNRNWVVGRPIVYTIVDVWSTAIMGFYVCFSGPSWESAKIALYSAAMGPNVTAELWGYENSLTLNPLQTLPYSILCDRGEYLSKEARIIGAKLLPSLSYAPPCRGDFKGGVEVMHRIEKDQQFLFIPGAIDARRKEYEFRKFNQNESVMTIRDYVAYLNIIFMKYNFSADRSHRLDAHMKASGVVPTPAGLWSWGHKSGLGCSRILHKDELTTSLLPFSKANITKRGVVWSGGEYLQDPTISQQWACHARNYGAKEISINYFPGSTKKIWTPNEGEKGLLELSLSDYKGSSGQLSIEEIADAHAFYLMKNADTAHDRTLLELKCTQQIQELINKCKRLTEAADLDFDRIKPSITHARQIEGMIQKGDLPLSKSGNNSKDERSQITATQQDHAEMMESILQSMTERNAQ